ncbi:MAG: hypothetical protein IT447_14755 [Phycisphaerales bacterium]|jgi:hypothetical protein|nr:hypothetical protein [Phycisphaerales bacterium]
MHDPGTDPLSPLAHRIIQENDYGRLVVESSSAAQQSLADVSAGQLLIAPIRSPLHAQAMLAGLWLWCDGLEQSHTISQGIDDPTGSFWHAILHRREGDFSNSKYWYARCADHPVLATLSARAADIINPLPADKFLLKLNLRGWNPDVFVDLVQHLHHQSDDPLFAAAVALQQLEWRSLFDHCTRLAVGK